MKKAAPCKWMSYGFIIQDDISSSSSSSSSSSNAFTFYLLLRCCSCSYFSTFVVLLSFVMTNACTNQIGTSEYMHDDWWWVGCTQKSSSFLSLFLSSLLSFTVFCLDIFHLLKHGKSSKMKATHACIHFNDKIVQQHKIHLYLFSF